MCGARFGVRTLGITISLLTGAAALGEGVGVEPAGSRCEERTLTHGTIVKKAAAGEVGGGCIPGEIQDCRGNCAPASWVGDGSCDNGAYVHNGVPIYFNCAAFQCDAGDCDPSQCGGGGGCGAGEIEDCNGNCAPDDWVGDASCDDGAYTYDGVAIYLNCCLWNCDEGDCCPNDCGGCWNCGGGGGACCSPYNTTPQCIEDTQQQPCLDNGGAYMGDGVTCAAVNNCTGRCDVECIWCWTGTTGENSCDPLWNGDGECDCGCQFVDTDCGCQSDADCSDLADQCNTGRCNTGTGECYADPQADGTQCNDELPGTCPDTCTGGACFGPPCPIDILGWESMGTHLQGVGEVGLAITQPVFSEPRLSGLSKLVVSYSGAINPATATPAAVTLVGNDSAGAGMDLSAYAIGTNAIAGDTQLEITFTPKLPNFAKYRVTLTGVESAGGGATVGVDSVVVTALVGDASGDLNVLPNDVGGVSNFVVTFPIDPAVVLEVRSDGDNNGAILPSDVGGVSNEVGKIASIIPDP